MTRIRWARDTKGWSSEEIPEETDTKSSYQQTGGTDHKIVLTALCADGLFCTAVPIIHSTAARILSVDVGEVSKL